MLAKTFDIATDGYDFPPYVERFKISAAAPGEDSKIAAVVCREGPGRSRMWPRRDGKCTLLCAQIWR